MRAGNLKHVVNIQQRADGLDSDGGTIDVWSNFIEGARAGIYPLKGRELMAAKAAQQETTTRFVLRYMAGITEDMRITYSGKYYDIDSIDDPAERHRSLIILAKTGLSEG